MPHAEQRIAQGALLQRYVQRHLLPSSGHYRDLFAQAGVTAAQLRTVDDLRRVPLSSKADLLPTAADPQRFRRFLLQHDDASERPARSLTERLSQVLGRWTRGAGPARRRRQREFDPAFVTFTGGRSSPPVPFFYSQHDLANLGDAGARMFEVAGLREDHRLACLLPYAPQLAFWQVFFASQQAGVLSLATGGGTSAATGDDLLALQRLRAQAAVGFPGYVHQLLRRAADEGADLSALERVVLGPEQLVPGQRQKIAALLEATGAGDARVVGTYGFTEARMTFSECPSHDGGASGYHLYPDLAIFEVVDPTTGEVVPDGEDGELVFTPLDARASTVFRYRTGDRVRGGIQYDPCPSCGRTVPRIASDVTRLTALTDLRLHSSKRTALDLDECAQLLGETAAVEEWQIELRKRPRDPDGRDELVVRVALGDATRQQETVARLREQFRRRLHLTPSRIELLELDDLLTQLDAASGARQRRFVDARQPV